MAATFAEPGEADLDLLEQRWQAIESLADEQFEVSLDESLSTLDVLQQIVDGDLVNHDGILAVGAVMGRVMIKNIEGLDWCLRLDADSPELCLRYEETDWHCNPIKMLSARIGRNEPVNLLEIFNAALLEVERLGGTSV